MGPGTILLRGLNAPFWSRRPSGLGQDLKSALSALFVTNELDCSITILRILLGYCRAQSNHPCYHLEAITNILNALSSRLQDSTVLHYHNDKGNIR